MLKRVKLIGTGWGNSGYYSARTLRLAEKERAFKQGTQLHWNHPTRTEMLERPERSLDTLTGVLTEDAKYLDHPVHGKGLYSWAKIYSDYEERVKAKGKDLSILAHGIKKHGEAPASDGSNKKGLIVERILPNNSNTVDFVTRAGAKGKVIFESATELPQHKYLLTENTLLIESDIGDTQYKDDNAMTIEQLTADLAKANTNLAEANQTVSTLRESVGTLETNNASLQAENRLLKANQALSEALNNDDFIGLKAHEIKAIKALVSVPYTDLGDINTEKLLEALKTEAKPFLEARKGGSTIPDVINMGSGNLGGKVDVNQAQMTALAEAAKGAKNNLLP